MDQQPVVLRCCGRVELAKSPRKSRSASSDKKKRAPASASPKADRRSGAGSNNTPRKPARKPARKGVPAKAARAVAKPVATRPRAERKRPPRVLDANRHGRNLATDDGQAADAAVAVEESAAEAKFTTEELEQFRQMLLEKRAQILGDVSTLRRDALEKDRREAAGDLSSMPIHMADIGSDNYELEFTLGLIEGERSVLREIDEALDRISKGTFGVCVATGRPIGKARLRAKPWAKHCYEYALAQEKGRSRRF